MCSFRPIFLMGSCLHKGVSLEFVRCWIRRKKGVLSLSSRVVGFWGSFARASSKFRRAFILNKKRPNTFLQTMVVTSGSFVAAAKFFRYVSFLLIPLSDHNGFHERVLKHSYIASSIATSGLCFQPVVAIYLVPLVFWPTYLKRVALFCLTSLHWKLECLDSSLQTYFDDACGPYQIDTYGFAFHCFFGRQP